MTSPPRESLEQHQPARDRRADLLAALGLFAVVFIAHAGSLSDGLFFDDYWHRATMRSFGWGFNDLVESATFKLPGELAHLWWQEQPLQWRYARPVAMLFMKLELLITGGSPFGIHLCALIWHGLATTLVYLLARIAIRSRSWAFVAAVTFAIQPHSVFGVSWIAARNALVSGFFFLAAMYTYAAAPLLKNERPAALSITRFLGVLVLWTMALFSRETAIIFPLLVPLIDLCRGGWSLARRRLPLYVLIGLLTGGYLYWRLIVFPTVAPPDIYYTSPSGPGYLLWAACKLLHMLFALIFQTPMFLGLATYDLSGSIQAALYSVIVVLLAAMAAWYFWAARGLQTRWFWPAWMVAAFVPVVPVFVMPHFAYLPAAAFSVMMGVMLQRVRKPWRAIVTTLVIVATLWSFGIYRYIWRGVLRGEQLIYADMQSSTPRPEPGGKLFLINLPVAGIYNAVALREAWDLDELESYVLTFAPHPLEMQYPSIVERTGECELTLSIEPPGYFSGLSGKMLLDGMRPNSPLTTGMVVEGDLFETTILEVDERGVTKLQFSFNRPLDSEDFYFYVSSPERPAYRLRLDRPAVNGAEVDTALFEQARSTDPAIAAEARRRIVSLAEPVAIQLADPIQIELDDSRLASAAALDRVEEWWRANDVPGLLIKSSAWRAAHADDLAQRRYYFKIADFAANLISSDLFLTGSKSDEPAKPADGS